MGDTETDPCVAVARDILRANDRGGYTVPTDRLYPFQWNWDSCFVAMGWATFDERRAWRELGLLLESQWDDGMVPSVIFHAPSDDYFPGPAVYAVPRTPPTSGTCNPPVLTTAVRRLHDTAGDPAAAADQLAAWFPKLVVNHRWWRHARDPHGIGLVATLHPWETGMDNSPAWDAALARVPTDTETVIRRRDTSHVDPAMRPHAEDYQRFIHLVDRYRGVGWDAARTYAVAPFRVADVGTNAILLRAEHDLLALAERYGSEADRAEIAGRIAALQAGVSRLWDAERGIFTSYDLIADAPIPASTCAGFLPLFAHAASPEQVASLAETIREWSRRAPWPVASAEPGGASFEQRRYWRGPVWAVVNWMIAEGLIGQGEAELGAMVRARTRRMIADAGFSEYFDPLTGAGLGGERFSWTAAIYLLV
jgi:hypothetical protein